MNNYNECYEPCSTETPAHIVNLLLREYDVFTTTNLTIRQEGDSSASTLRINNLLPDMQTIDSILDSSFSIHFSMLKAKWESETEHLSSVTEIATHPAYQQIIGMGQVAIPLILSEMEKEYGHWFWALQSITGENPITQEQRGQIEQMTEAWLCWGRENGYLNESAADCSAIS